MKQLAFYGMAMELLALEAVFVFAGKWLDDNFGWKGLGVAAGCFLALFLWVLHLIKALKKLDKDENDQA